MSRRTVSAVIIAMLLTSILVVVFNVQPVRASGTITIRDDGSIDPPTAPISTADNLTYILTGNIISDADGIVIERSNITIDGAGYTLQGPGYAGSKGIYSQGTSNVTIRNTNFMDFHSCIKFESASYVVIRGNNMTANVLSSYGVNLFNSSNSNISGNNIKNSGYLGIGLFVSSFNTVSGNNVTANTMGVALDYSFYNVVSKNNIAKNVFLGVELSESSYNVVSRNKIDSIIVGTSTFNTISNNILSDIQLIYLSNSNTVSENNITNASPGIAIVTSSENRIFHNNFIDNIPQVNSDGSLNFWDVGYPSGGNYWSEYNGTDQYGGPYQNETGSDGISDTSYVIDGNNRDYYPLMQPWSASTRREDVAVTNVTANRMWVYQGFSVNFNATIFNTGDFGENVAVTFYYNITADEVIGTQNITILAGENETLSFLWDTTSVPYCHSYTITAVATIPLDDSPADNTLACGPINVRIKGDISGDGTVDGSDLIIIARAFGSYGPNCLYPGCPPSQRWNLDSDINGDGVVDGSDLIVAARNFGK